MPVQVYGLSKEKIILTDFKPMDYNELRELVHEEVEQFFTLNSIPLLDTKTLNEYIQREYADSLNEMAKLNVRDFGYFPYNKFDIKIWSNDHNPPHFHVMCDGWDIVVSIENGEILRVKTIGKDSKVYSYVEKNIIKWLKEEYKGRSNTQMTNQDMAFEVWEQNNTYC